MLKKLTLDNFKNFQHAELELGAFTVLIGANAAGKSNIREAFRFLHGIGRNYTFAEIIGEKWVDGGVRVWQGIRGGIREICYLDKNVFGISAYSDTHKTKESGDRPLIYGILVTLDNNKKRIIDTQEAIQSIPISKADWQGYKNRANTQNSGAGLQQSGLFKRIRKKHESEKATVFKQMFNSIRFFDFVPDAMRIPSVTGQVVLGDRGENLSSVLYAICEDSQQKKILLSWVEELTPMDAVDFEFPSDQVGRILMTIVERNGQRISAYSMSDGTLRFLAILAAFLGPKRARFYFLEEIENGIHPTRLHLLTQFIENQVAQGDIQVVATTHSPLLLNYLKPKTLENASLLYRLEDQPDAHIKRIMDIPNARQLVKKQSVMRLYESGWFENSMFFLDDDVEDVA